MAKVAELLMQRKDMTKDLGRIKEELLGCVISTATETSDDPLRAGALLVQYSEMLVSLGDLNLKIDTANAPIRGRLNQVRTLDSKISFLQELRTKLITANSVDNWRYTATQVGSKKNLSIDEVNAALKRTETERRALDREIQAVNWQTEG